MRPDPVKIYRLLSALLIALLCTPETSSMPVSSFIIRPENIDQTAYSSPGATYRLISADEDFSLPETASQRVIRSARSSGATEITVSTGDNRISQPGNTKKFLEATQYLNFENTDVKKTAYRFQNSADIVKDVSLFVFNHITDKKIGIPMLPASSILKNRSGDCTEHSILTVTMLRALKIPARAVTGVILVENFSGQKNVFVYHMWCEAYINGRWRLVDSTRPYEYHPERYIAFSYHNLKTEIPLDFLNAISSATGIRIIYMK